MLKGTSPYKGMYNTWLPLLATLLPGQRYGLLVYLFIHSFEETINGENRAKYYPKEEEKVECLPRASNYSINNSLTAANATMTILPSSVTVLKRSSGKPRMVWNILKKVNSMIQ